MIYLSKISNVLSAISEGAGRLVAWLVLAMTLLVTYDVAMRYLFESGSVALQELEWHLFALLFLLGAAYTHKHDGHVRVDIIYQSRFFNVRRRAWVDLIGSLIFLLPFCVLIIQASWPFVINAYDFGETSPDPGGLPYRYLLKAAIPLGFALLALQGVAAAISSLQILMGSAPRGEANSETISSENQKSG